MQSIHALPTLNLPKRDGLLRSLNKLKQGGMLCREALVALLGPAV
ncbi:hypothetical protein CCP3SC1_20010 [Gammaproteobacteria bacterium]